MSKLHEYLESTGQLRNRPRKFGFRINVKDEKTGEITSSFTTGDTIEEFMKHLLDEVPDLAKESQDQIRKNLAELEKNVMN